MNDLITKFLQKKSAITNFYRRKFFDQKVLLTTDFGTWVIINIQEYKKFSEGVLDEALYLDFEKRGLIITKKNQDDVVNQYYNRYKKMGHGTGLHIIIPTKRCNFRCVYCHSEAASPEIEHKDSYDMTEETLMKTLSFIFSSPREVITIEFQGGEPLLNQEIIRKTLEYSAFLNKASKKKYQFSLVSNLSCMNESFLEFLLENKKVIRFGTSLDGPQYVHDMNRKFAINNSGTYEHVIKWVQTIKEKGLNIGMLMVTTKYSLPYWKEIIDEYIHWGQRMIQIKPLDYLGYAVKVWGEIGYTQEEFVDFWTKSMDYIFELMGKGIFIEERYFSLVLNNILHGNHYNFLDFESPCGIIRGQLAYDYNGNIYCCDEARILNELIMGNVYKNDYYRVMRSDQTKSLIRASINEGCYCDSCAYKPFCGVCVVRHYAVEHNFNIKINKLNSCFRHKAVFDYVFKKLLNEPKKIQQYYVANMLVNKFQYPL